MPLRKEELFEKHKIGQNNQWLASTIMRIEDAMDEYAQQCVKSEAEKANELVEALEFTKGQVQDMDKWNQDAKKEIERLKGLVSKVWDLQYPHPEAVRDIWQQFKTENNL